MECGGSTCVSTRKEQRGKPGVSCFITHHLSDRKGLQSRATTALGYRHVQPCLDLYVSAGDTNSHPHTCAASLHKYSGESAEKAAQVNLYTSPHRQVIEHTPKAIIANHCHYHYPKKHSKLFSTIMIPKQTMTPLYRSLLAKKSWEEQGVWLTGEKPWTGTSVYFIGWGTDVHVHLNITAQSKACKLQQCEAIQPRLSMPKMDNGEKNYVGTLHRSFKGWKGIPHHIQSARLRLSVGICLTITSTLKGSC